MIRISSALICILLLAGCGPAATATVVPTARLAAQADPAVGVPTSVPATPAALPTSTTPPPPTATPAPLVAAWSYPIGLPGQLAGDGFFIRHGYAVENTWYNPGYWHTGEDWYALAGAETAGAAVYAVADGTVVYVGGNYPGLVVIIQHADLFSLYGHLDPAVLVRPGDAVTRGTRLGSVLRRGDAVPSHLHFELRTFLTASEVNGDAPRFAFRCGPSCPPGPGYWPMADRDRPSALGWRNPTHVIAGRAFAALSQGGQAEVIVAAQPISATVPVWSSVPEPRATTPADTLALEPGRRWGLLAVTVGPEASDATGAGSYQVWYQIMLGDGRTGWVEASVASTFETGADGRASSVQFNFLPNDGTDS